MHGKFGVGAVADVLSGNQTDQTTRWRLEELSVFGLLREYPTKRIIAMLHRLIEAGLARQRLVEKKYPVVELTTTGILVMKARQAPPATLRELASHVR